MNIRLRILYIFCRFTHPSLFKLRKTLLGFLTLAGLCLPAYGQGEITIEEEISYPFLEKLIVAARTNYPRGKSYDARLDLAEKGIRKTRLSYFDIISFSYLLSPSNGTSALNPTLLNGYQFGFFANIGSLLQKPTQIKQAKDELKVIELEKEVYFLNLDADVKRRYFEYAKAKAIYRVLAKSVLDSQIMAEDVRHKFERGETTYENYNKALLELSNRLQTKISFAGDILIAKGSLEELLGQKLEDIQ